VADGDEDAVIIQPPAEADIAEAHAWLAEQSPEAAARWLEALDGVVDSLERLPQRCGSAPESRTFDREIRQILHGVYRVLFTIKGSEVHVLHVRHGSVRVLRPQDEP
jgi:plasmid stabilization system protein ParE